MRKKFDNHLELECNYFVKCEQCEMEHRIGELHGLEECVAYLNRQIINLKDGNQIKQDQQQ